ncbi:uncharacterized protein PgNI_02435 [Pyricularia grisea]|uniref:Uncharacterized protein n=1 Tax=Pyricularia grisea TaxID=148305 RepID=A0A6P8BHQ8_PYRGI|nr:uncharacterized protein PgNI_02435 [Pyricularia grisea]TLD16260.1 hypothetical protein PgNI_02435 [Pyricularia grisea]
MFEADHNITNNVDINAQHVCLDLRPPASLLIYPVPAKKKKKKEIPISGSTDKD